MSKKFWRRSFQIALWILLFVFQTSCPKINVFETRYIIIHEEVFCFGITLLESIANEYWMINVINWVILYFVSFEKLSFHEVHRQFPVICVQIESCIRVFHHA
jgi:hypothetical protein